MASGNVADLDAMHDRLGVSEEEVVDLSPRGSERAAWALSRFAPALAGLAVLFLLFELKTPGVGLWAGLAALLGAGFLLAQYSLDLMENFELLLIVIGVGLVAAEMFTIVGGGLLAALGAAVGLTGLVLGFLPNELAFDFGDPVFVDALRDAAFGGATSVGIVAVGAVLAVRYLPRSIALHRRITVRGAVTATSAGEIEARTATLLGQRGEAAEALHPSGMVRIGEESIRRPGGARRVHCRRDGGGGGLGGVRRGRGPRSGRRRGSRPGTGGWNAGSNLNPCAPGSLPERNPWRDRGIPPTMRNAGRHDMNPRLPEPDHG